MPKIRLDHYDDDLSVSDLEFQDDFDRKRKKSKKGAKSIAYDGNDHGNKDDQQAQKEDGGEDQ